jgi:hypothetical protein
MASRENAIKNNLNDRARKVGQFDELTTQDIDALIAFYDFTCLYPGCGVKPASSVDHVKPLSKGGTNTFDNLQLLCVNHNKQKGDEEIDYREGKVFTRESETATDLANADWSRIKTRYLSEEISLRDLANAENVSESAIMKRSAKENWTILRQQYRSKVTAEVSKLLLEKEIKARVVAGETARAVISSWLNSVKEEASASDALNAAKLLLVMAGESTDRVEIHRQLIEKVLTSNELGQTGSPEVGEPASNWLRTLATASTDTFVA